MGLRHPSLHHAHASQQLRSQQQQGGWSSPGWHERMGPCGSSSGPPGSISTPTSGASATWGMPSPERGAGGWFDNSNSQSNNLQLYRHNSEGSVGVHSGLMGGPKGQQGGNKGMWDEARRAVEENRMLRLRNEELEARNAELLLRQHMAAHAAQGDTATQVTARDNTRPTSTSLLLPWISPSTASRPLTRPLPLVQTVQAHVGSGEGVSCASVPVEAQLSSLSSLVKEGVANFRAVIWQTFNFEVPAHIRF